MDNKINLSQLTDLFCNVSNLGKGASTTFVKTFFETIVSEVSSGGQVRIKGFGLFRQIVISDRESVDVNTGERIVISGHQKVSFTPEPELKDFINKPFASFETVLIDASGQTEPTALKDTPVETVAETTPIIVQHEIQSVAPTGSPVDIIEVKRIMRGLRALLIAIIVLLVALIVSYCIWPLNLVHYMRKNMESVEQVSSNGENVRVSSVDIVRHDDNAPVQGLADTVHATASQSQAQWKSQPKRENEPAAGQRTEKNDVTAAGSVQKSEFTLTEADSNKPLDQFTVRDTTSYRMTNVIITTHVLKSGETLTKVSEKYYGTKKLWPYIAAYNNISNANSASVGTRLKIPILVNK